MALDVRSASHPFEAIASQSPRPVVHAPTAHTPAAQVTVAVPGNEHRELHAPQFEASVRVLISQPFEAVESQSAKPVVHA